jgi:hypothetical protein
MSVLVRHAWIGMTRRLYGLSSEQRMTPRWTRIFNNKADKFVTSSIAVFSFEAKRCFKSEILFRENYPEE